MPDEKTHSSIKLFHMIRKLEQKINSLINGDEKVLKVHREQLDEHQSKIEALEKANDQANQSLVSIATQLEETEGRIMRLYEIENSTTIKKDLKEIWERHINDINMHQNRLSELKNLIHANHKDNQLVDSQTKVSDFTKKRKRDVKNE